MHVKKYMHAMSFQLFYITFLRKNKRCRWIYCLILYDCKKLNFLFKEFMWEYQNSDYGSYAQETLKKEIYMESVISLKIRNRSLRTDKFIQC